MSKVLICVFKVHRYVHSYGVWWLESLRHLGCILDTNMLVHQFLQCPLDTSLELSVHKTPFFLDTMFVSVLWTLLFLQCGNYWSIRSTQISLSGYKIKCIASYYRFWSRVARPYYAPVAYRCSALIIGTSISAWRVIWSDYARLYRFMVWIN